MAGTGPTPTVGGSIKADGSSTVFPITQVVAKEWQKQAPAVNVDVGTSGTGRGFEKFCMGETDISDASRPIGQKEAALCRRNGIEHVELQVAIDGVSVLVNATNDFVECLTTAELNAIWKPDSKVNDWSEVREGFPSRPLTLYAPGPDSGTFDYFTAKIVGREGASRSDYTASEDDNVLVQGVARDPHALGYFGFDYLEQNNDKLRALAVDHGNGCVSPTTDTIASGKYAPLSRPLFIYVSRKAASRPEVASFVDAYLAMVVDLAAVTGYVPIPTTVLEEQRAKWKQFKQGV